MDEKNCKLLYDVTLRRKSGKTTKARCEEGLISVTVDVMKMSTKNTYDHKREAMLTFAVNEETNEGKVFLYREQNGIYKRVSLDALIGFINEYGEELGSK